ncbi:PTS glucitol/sorbitol transporter subunit IIA [Lactovum odontotermitis]
MTEKIFETKVVQVGTQAPTLLQEANMIILFGLEAPADLAEYCYKITNKNLCDSIEKNDMLMLGGKRFQITAVGAVVEQNLKTLGHITISFDGAEQATLPGTLHVKAEQEIEIGQDSVIQIIKP